MDRLLSPADIAEVRGISGDGLRSIQDLQDAPVIVTFVRDGVEIAENVHLIRIRLDDRQVVEQSALQGATESRMRGTLKGWAVDLAGVGPGDRFAWGSTPCRVIVAESPRFGVIDVRFETLGTGK